MNAKSKLKSFFESKQENTQYIEKYEQNVEFFNDLLKNGHKEDIEFVIPIKLYKYADPLNQNGKFNKALIVLTEIENDLEKLKEQSDLYTQCTEGVGFLRGVCLGKLKKYADSNREFQKLLRKNPDNVSFIYWYRLNKKNRISAILDKISIFGVLFYLIILIINVSGYKVDNLIIREFGLAIAILAFALSFVWRKLIDKQPISIEK